MEEETITVRVLRFVQNGQVIYTGVMDSADILAISEVDVRDESANPSGYQRHRDETRCRRLAEFINQPTSALPGSILLNLRGSSRFVANIAGCSQGLLNVPKRRGAAWLVDGQHRMGGFEHTEKHLLLPVVLFENLPRRQEMMNFFIINDTQKGVNTSLTLSLLGELRENKDDWKLRAHDIIDIINRDPQSPWFERVNMTAAKGMHRPVNLASFVNALAPLVRQHSIYKSMSLSDQALLLNRYWGVCRELFPDAWREPSRYILLKSFGVYTMSQVAAYVLDLCAASSGDFSVAAFRRYLGPLAGFDWQRDTSPFRALGGHKGCKEATLILLTKLPKLTISIER